MAEKARDKSPTGKAPSEDDIMRILVATDNHLGVWEKDRIRRDDSFVSFEEIFQIAEKEKVDFVLLGGDVFHENKPSRLAMYRALEILRTHCLSDRPVRLQIHSDQSEHFRNKFGTVNYEDPNFNVGLPVFAIHGNHDDPSGEKSLAALDLLSVCNFVNYFGKSESIDDIHVRPILMSKGETKIALYGLGNIRDERLYRTFAAKKVKFYRPAEQKESWFNIFVLHQNRNQHHTAKNTITEGMLRGFFDFVVWGHEHECKIKPQVSAEGNFQVSQPGSSVATSLGVDEAAKKHVGILEIHKDKFRMRPIPLQTVRPMIVEDVVLSEHSELGKSADSVSEFLTKIVEDLIDKVNAEMLPPPEVLAKHKSLSLPIIRVRVNYAGGYATINPQRFGQQFVDKVANPSDVLLFQKPKPVREKSAVGGSAAGVKKTAGGGGAADGEGDLLDSIRPEPLEPSRIEDLVADLLRTSAQLKLLDELSLQEAVQSFVEKGETHAITEFVEKELDETRKHVWLESKKLKKEFEPDDIDPLVLARMEQQRKKHESEDKVSKILSRVPKTDEDGNGEGDEMDAEEQFAFPAPSSPAKTTKRGASKTSTTSTRGRGGKGRGGKKATAEDDEEVEPAAPAKRGRGGRGGRGGAASTTSTRGKKKAAASEDDDDDEIVEIAPSPATRRTTRSATGAATSTTGAKRGRATLNVQREVDSDDDAVKVEEVEEDEAPAKRRKTAAASTTAKKSGGSSKLKTVVDSEEDAPENSMNSNASELNSEFGKKFGLAAKPRGKR